MSEEDQITEAEIEAPATQPESMDLDSLLAEFKEAVPAPEPSGESEQSDAPAEPDAKALAELGGLREWAVDVEKERMSRREAEDAAAIFDEGKKAIEGFDSLAGDYAKTWFVNEYQTNRELQQAWDHRHDSEDAARWSSRCVRHALNDLQAAGRHEQSRIEGLSATADRDAVAAAVRGSRGNGDVESPAPNYGDMTDAEFKADVKKRYGYTPGI